MGTLSRQNTQPIKLTDEQRKTVKDMGFTDALILHEKRPPMGAGFSSRDYAGRARKKAKQKKRNRARNKAARKSRAINRA